MLSSEFVFDLHNVIRERDRSRPVAVVSYRTEIDKGRQDGVVVNDPVIGDDALVGRIALVTPTVWIVALITDPSFAVAAQVQDGSGDTGVLVTEAGKPMGLLLLLDLPNHAQATSGQQVVAAGVSRGSLASLFPAGIPIGQISNANPNKNLSQRQVPVTPTADIRQLAAVQILTRPRDVTKQGSGGGISCTPDSAAAKAGGGSWEVGY